MSSIVISVADLDFKMLRTFYLKVDMEYDNRKNAALAILSKLSRDLLEIFKNLGGCLAIPQRDLCTIMLVSTPENMKNQGIMDYLKHQKMTIKLECECDSMAIEKCLPFAFFYFMERVKWFRIGECFVQDGFLWWKQTNLPRIQILTHCSESGHIYVKFTAELIRIHPFEHWILDSDERFADLNSGPITKKIRARWVSCLPKLGKGQLVKIHRKIPDDSPFENYEQMKSYWKKTYGYELPPAEPEVYYDILFHGGQSMLYPLYCVLTGTPEVLPLRHNSTVTREALETFMKAFREANIEICGHPVGSDQKDCQAMKSYLDVMSMQPNAKLQKEVKISRKASIPEVKKIYPKIPMKRTISSDGVPSTSEAVPKKRKRPGFGIEVD
ncbi:unnamed protein product [Caenorhabditis brenneri]